MSSLPASFTLDTVHLRLRIISREDFPHIFSATRYSGFNDGMLWEAPATMEELVQPLENGLRAWEAGTAYAFTIEDKKTGAFLGRISIRQTDRADVWNIGFWTHPAHQGRGIMSEAAAAVIDFGFDQLEATEFEAFHALWNKASERVLRKNGLRFVRYIEQGFRKKGEWVAENLLSIKRQDWR